MNDADKKILIISHNPLSQVNNNGKTLVSIFDGVPQENIYQIYLNAGFPDFGAHCHYLQLHEKQIIASVLKMKNLCCREVRATPEKVSSAAIQTSRALIHTKRLLREGVWKFAIWKSKLKDWLKDKHFDVVFFMAGDGMFAYDVYRFVMKHTAAKGCMFFTDDYVIGKTSHTLPACLRRGLLKRKIRKTMPIVHELYVISDEMKDAYDKLWDVDSYVIRNFSVEKKESADEPHPESSSKRLTMVYAGGLHYNRWKVLAQIAEVMKEINRTEIGKCDLKIYSSQKLSDEIIEHLNLPGASEFCGAASASQIADIYAKADILLHVESFDKKAMAATKYSFSTKIPEYLSAGKCVLAVGPEEVASIGYLKNFACVINDGAELSSMLRKLVHDSEYRDLIRSACEKQYEKDFSRNKQKECLEHILSV